MPGTTAWVLADQLTTSNPALDGADRVLIVQSSAALQAKRFHRQKLHLVLVAVRHFACELELRGLAVDQVRAESLASGLRRHVRCHRPERVLLMAPKSAAGRATLANLPRVQLLPDAMFLTDPEEFSRWVAPRGRRRGAAVVAALSGDRHALPTTLAAISLREDNWLVHHLGADLPPTS